MVASYLPLKDANGKEEQYLANSKKGVTFADRTHELPNFLAYGSAWLAKKNWMTVTATFHIRCSMNLYEMYVSKTKEMMQKGIEMIPKKINMKYEGNIPVAAVLPSFSSLDTKSLSFFL